MLSPEYWILLSIIILCIIKYTNRKIVYIAIVYITVLAVFRDISVGTDFMGYEEDFVIINESTSLNDIRHTFEPGFIYAMRVYKKFSQNYLLFISLLYIPSILSTLKFVNDHNVNWAFAIFFYVTLGHYFQTYNIMRQMMVISLCLSYLPFLYKKKYGIFAGLIIITSLLFHRSELLILTFIPIYYWVDKHTTIYKNLLYVGLALSFSVFYIGNTFFKTFFANLTLLMLSDEHYANYILSENEDSGNMTSLMYTLLGFIIVYVKNPKTYRFQTYIYIFSIIIYNIFNTFSLYATRVSFPFMMMGIVLLPQMIMESKTMYRKLFVITTIVFSLGLFFNRYYFHNAGAVNPYIFRKV